MTNVDNSTIEPYKNRGLGKQKNVGKTPPKRNTSILYNIINCHAKVSHKHGIHGKLGLQLCLKKNQNTPRHFEFVTLHLGPDGCH